MLNCRNIIGKAALAAMAFTLSAVGSANASELDLIIPSLSKATYSIFGLEISGNGLLLCGMLICLLGMLFGLWEFFRIKRCRLMKLCSKFRKQSMQPAPLI